MPFQICRGTGDGKLLVAGCEFGGEGKVALGVDRVVVVPVSDGRDGDAGAEAIGVGERVEGECTSPTPAPPAEAFGIELWILGECCVNDSELIFKLDGTEGLVRRLGESGAAHAGPPI